MSAEAEEMIVEAPDPLIGATVQDRYRVVRKLGEGGMGRVYEAEHLLVKRRVAVKCLHGQYASRPDVLQRFLREAQAASTIGNEHIVDVLDMGRMPDGAPFMAMEFLAGKDLGEAIACDGAFTVGRISRIIQQVCAAVQAAHDKGIVHRDLKPENIFLVRRGEDRDYVKVLDFGIAKFLHDAGGDLRTGTGVMIGTATFMAPEQMEGAKDVDHRADLYALGVILFAGLASRVPFQSESIARLAYDVCMIPAPDVRTFRPDVPADLAAIVAKLLEKSREDRIQTARELAAAIVPFSMIEDAPVVLEGERSPVDALGGTLASNPSSRLSMVSRVTAPGASAIRSRGYARRPIYILSALLGAVAVGGVVLSRFRHGATRLVQSEAVATVVPVAASAPAPTPISVPPEPVSERTVNVYIRIEPESATLLVDGQPVANPWDVELPVSDHPRRVEAFADGYERWTRSITLQYAQRVTYSLRRVSLPSALSRGSSSRSRDRTRERQVEVLSPAPPSPQPSVPPPTPETQAPPRPTQSPRGRLLDIDPDRTP